MPSARSLLILATALATRSFSSCSRPQMTKDGSAVTVVAVLLIFAWAVTTSRKSSYFPLQQSLTSPSCPCGAHFCYVCGSPWNPRTCDCPQWDENRLQERAVQIANRDPRHRLYRPPQGALDPGVAAAAAVPARAPAIPEDVDQDNLAVAIRPIQAAVAQAPAVDNTQLAVLGHLPDYQRLVDQIRDNLEANHECNHEKWRWISGPHRCEECNFQLPNYIFECRQCRIRACWRCRRNRL